MELQVVGIVEESKPVVYLNHSKFKQLSCLSNSLFIVTSNQRTVVSFVKIYKEEIQEDHCLVSQFLANNIDSSLHILSITIQSPSLKVQDIPAASVLHVQFHGEHPIDSDELSFLCNTLLVNTVILPGQHIPIQFYGHEDLIIVHSYSVNGQPDLNQPVKISATTKIEVVDPEEGQQGEFLDGPFVNQWVDDVVQHVFGLDESIQDVVYNISSAFAQNKGIGFLFHGVPGTGKTRTAQAIADNSGFYHEYIDSSSLFRKLEGESEVNISRIFQRLRSKCPSILILDDFSSIGTSRDLVSSSTEKRILDFIITEMQLSAHHKIAVIAITHNLKLLDKSLLGPFCFSNQVEFKIPDAKTRLVILKNLISPQLQAIISPEFHDLEYLSKHTHGYTAADLKELLRQSFIQALHNHPALSNPSSPSPFSTQQLDPQAQTDLISSLSIQKHHFNLVLKKMKPSGLLEYFTEKPSTTFKDLIGIDHIIQQLKIAVVQPLQHPERLREMGLGCPAGVLLYGPPGTGKTALAHATAAECAANFISVEIPSLIGKYVGESERAVRNLFERARQSAPCILLIEQLDAIALSRGDYYCAGDAHDRLLTTLLTEIDGIFSTTGAPSVIIIGVASDPGVIDGALLRAGRLDYHIEVPLPDQKQRLSLVREWVRRNGRFKIGKEMLEGVARRTEGASPAVLLNIFKEAALLAFRDNIQIEQVEEKYFEIAFKSLSASSKPLRPTKQKPEVPIPKFTLDIPLEFNFGLPSSPASPPKSKDLPLPLLSEDLRKSLPFLGVPVASPPKDKPVPQPQPSLSTPPQPPTSEAVQLIMREFEVSKQIAEQSLLKFDNNVVEALRSFLSWN